MITPFDLTELFLFIFLLALLTPLLGIYMVHVYSGKRSLATAPLKWLERLSYRFISVNPDEEMRVSTYAKSLIKLNGIGFLFLFLLLLLQGYLPLNPQNFSGLSFDLAFNTAISLMTNTGWQAYAGESDLSYFSQMAGITVVGFLGAATGLSVLIALIRGITRNEQNTIGNFYQDFVRSIIYLLLPLSFILAIFLLSEGVIQTFAPYVTVTTLENNSQMIPLGPVASHTAIKLLGTVGAGFFNANSAHPFENPSALSNLIEILSFILIPSASVYYYGVSLGNKNHARIIFTVILSLLAIGICLSLYGEYLYSASLDAYPVMEGKETRFGLTSSVIWSTGTTATSSGSINAMMSSLSPISSGIALFNMLLGELIFGGVGTGLCTLILYILLTVFLSGLMVGRTPEYFGKKIEVKEMQWIIISIFTSSCLILIGSAISFLLPIATSQIKSEGPHGFTTLLYAFASASSNNGSAFSSLDSNTPYYNLILGSIMILSRLAILIPSLMIAGLLAKKKIAPTTLGTFSTNTSIFVILLLSVILIMGSLTFFPGLALGPVVEQLLMTEKRFF